MLRKLFIENIAIIDRLEIEFEDGTKEINIEFASIDFEFHPLLNLRGGVVMNPIDHPMGGGEGRSSGGGHPRSPWGQLAKGFKTRKKKNPTSKFIVARRKK